MQGISPFATPFQVMSNFFRPPLHTIHTKHTRNPPLHYPRLGCFPKFTHTPVIPIPPRKDLDHVSSSLFTAEQCDLQTEARRIIQSLLSKYASELREKHCVPRELWKELGAVGFLGIIVPEAYGGSDGSFVEQLIIMEELSRISPSVGLAYAAHSNLCVDRILNHGTEDQKKAYLPGLCDGTLVGALAMTEVSAGSDAASILTTATKGNGGWYLTGSKTFVTNGPDADLVVTYAKTDPSRKHRGITSFIVDMKSKGLTKGRPFSKLGMRESSTCELFFDNVFVPDANLLGELNKGIYIMMKGLDSERLILSGGPIGIMQGCLDSVLPYCNEREQFGQKIAEFQLIKAKIADMYTSLLSSRCYAYQIAKQFQHGRGVHLSHDCAAVYLHASEAASRSTSQAVQILGGYGYTEDFPLEMFFRDSKLYEIGGGASEIRRLIIGNRLLRDFL